MLFKKDQTEIKCHYIPDKHEMLNLSQMSIKLQLGDFKMGESEIALSFIVCCWKTCAKQY